MATVDRESRFDTHEVFNQSTPLENYNLYVSDTPLREAVTREGAGWADAELQDFGGLLGRAETLELGRLANENPPKLKTHDRYGHRIDEVEYHPAYHECMRIGIEAGIHSTPWTDPGPGAQVARAAKEFMMGQVEAGVGCPITMTYAVVPALRHEPEVAARWEPKILQRAYDRRFLPMEQKESVQFGMAMTEKQGGSDVRANTTRAEAIGAGGPGEEYLLTGHKWFCSAPMSDAFLTLAHTDTGLTCFLVPRFLPDGSRNRFFIQRLKDKLGNRSNASSEIEYDRTWGVMVGEEGRGVPTIIEMVGHTRLDCAIFSAGLMRQCLAQAMNHTRARKAFGKLLIDQPLMRNVLADLAVESEAATMVAMRLARAYDDCVVNPEADAFKRLATAVTKYWLCKRAPNFAYESLECHGGPGYVEESIMPRLFRESPLTSIWEGSGNVMCLDVLRAMGREPDSAPAFIAELEAARGADRRLDAAIDRFKDDLAKFEEPEAEARRLVERMARLLEGSLMVRHGHPSVAEAFLATRIERDRGEEYGTLPRGLDIDGILTRAMPVTP
jgi:putative acyl-CoA dehydrogenase